MPEPKLMPIEETELARLQIRAERYEKAIEIMKWSQIHVCCPDKIREFLREEEKAGRCVWLNTEKSENV